MTAVGADAVTLEVVRARLESVTRDMGAAVIRTASSPIVSEGKDFSCALYDASGDIIANAFFVLIHMSVTSYSVKTTIEDHGDEVEEGDIFLANDPHWGGGCHPSDVVVMKPLFYDGSIIAWASSSAHMLDVGGMTPGSWAATATDCYQEALRLPPVKLFRRGRVDKSVWNLVLNNIRIPERVGMDLRSLAAATNVANTRVVEIVDKYGPGVFHEVCRTSQDLSEEQLRERINSLPDDEYSQTLWAEYNDEAYELRCVMTCAGDGLTFDFTGSAPQCSRFINSTEHITYNGVLVPLVQTLAFDLPLNHGLLRPIEVIAPLGSIVAATIPAPISAAHVHVGLTLADVAGSCLRQALARSSDEKLRRRTTGAFANSVNHSVWAGINVDGEYDAVLDTDGYGTGGAALRGADGCIRAPECALSSMLMDTETAEHTFPVLYLWRRFRADSGGAGTFRGGTGIECAFTPYGTDRISGTLFSSRYHFPTPSFGGGYPASTGFFRIARQTSVRECVERGQPLPLAWNQLATSGETASFAPNSAGIVLERGDVFNFGTQGGGGLGDPLCREPARVLRDIRDGLVSVDAARTAYGVVVQRETLTVQEDETARKREAIRRSRLGVTPRAPVSRAPTTFGVIFEDDGCSCGCCGEILLVGDWRQSTIRRELTIGREEAASMFEAHYREAGPVLLVENFCPACGSALAVDIALAPRS